MEHYAMGMQPQGDTTLYNNPVTFYTYAGPIVVDKWCSGCIFHLIKGFKCQVIDYNRAIKWFGGTSLTNVKNITIACKWFEEDVREHRFNIPSS